MKNRPKPAAAVLTLTVVLIFFALAPGSASAQITADYCSCVVSQAYFHDRAGALKPAGPVDDKIPDRFSVDLRNGSIHENPFEDFGTGKPNISVSANRKAWHATYTGVGDDTQVLGSTLNIWQRPDDPGFAPIVFLASSGRLVLSGICLESPPADLLSD